MREWNSRIGLTVRMTVVLGLLVVMPIWALTDARRITDHDGQTDSLPRALIRAGGEQAPDGDSDSMWEVPVSARTPVSDDAEGVIRSLPIEPAVDPGALAWAREERKLPRLDDPHRRPVDESTRAADGAIRERLQKLGATYMMLEPIDSTGMVRFHCRMPLPDNPVYERPFQAASPDPVAAMSDVLKQVQQWVGRRDTMQSNVPN